MLLKKEIWMNMVNTNYISTQDVINNIQQLKGKTNLKFYKSISNYYDNMNITHNEDLFAKNAHDISKIYHEVLLLMKFLETKPQVKNVNINLCDFYYTVIKNREEKEFVDNKYENGFISLNDVIIPNHFVGLKDREEWDLR